MKKLITTPIKIYMYRRQFILREFFNILYFWVWHKSRCLKQIN